MEENVPASPLYQQLPAWHGSTCRTRCEELFFDRTFPSDAVACLPNATRPPETSAFNRVLTRCHPFLGCHWTHAGTAPHWPKPHGRSYGPELVRKVMISEAWYRTTLPKLKAAIEDKTLALPEDANILSDFRLLRVVRGVARVPDSRTTDSTGNRHGDSAVAAAMLSDAREELGSVEPWEYEGVGMQSEVDFKGW